MTNRHTLPDATAGQPATEFRESLERLTALARRRWRTFLLTFVVAAVAIQAVAFVWPGTYEAHAAIMLQRTRSGSDVDPDPKQATVVADSISVGEVNSEIAVLTSRQVLESTAKATGLDSLPAPWYLRIIQSPIRAYEASYAWLHNKPSPTQAQRALASFDTALTVERLKESNILVISYRTGDPRFAEIVLNEMLKQYLAWHLTVHSRNDVQPFFTTQSGILRQEIAGLQTQLRSLKQTAGVVDFTSERDVALRRESELREEALRLERQLGELDGRTAALKRALEGDQSWTRVSTTTKSASAVVESMRAELLRLELEQIRLESRYTSASPLVIENRAKVDAARRALDDERRATGEESTLGLNPTLVALQQDVQRATADRFGTAERLTLVTRQMHEARARLSQLDERSAEADRIELQLRSAKDRYLMYLDRTEKARVDSALDESRVANVSVVQYASASPKPIAPKHLITLIASIVGGIAIALLVCAAIELMTFGLAGTLEAMAPRPEPAL